MKIIFFTTFANRSPIIEYIDNLSIQDQAKIFNALASIEIHGLKTIGLKFRQIKNKLWEIKLSAYRIFYVLINHQEMMILHIYRKQSQKLPKKEKEIALKRMKEANL